MKKFSFWLTILSILVCLVNVTGMDDKNLLLFFSSPHLLLLEDYSRYLREIGNETTQLLILYFINIVGWFLIGWLIDTVTSKIKHNLVSKFTAKH